MGRSTGPRWPLRMAIGVTVALLGLWIAPAAWAEDLQSAGDPVQDTATAVTDPVKETVEAVEETVAETTETVTGTVEETVGGGDSGETSPSTAPPADSSADKSASGVSTESEATGGSGQQEPGTDGSASTAPAGEGSATGAGTGSPGAQRSDTAPRSDAGAPSSLARAEGGSSTPTVPAALSHELVTTPSPALQATTFGGPADLFRSLARSGQGLATGGNPVFGVSGEQLSAALVFVLLALALVAVGKGALRLDTAKPA